MNVAVIKYNAGNIRSVDYALKRLGVEAVITADKEVLQAADKVIFPGVGQAETTMNHLRATGMDELIKNLRQPVLGICLGMQMAVIEFARNVLHMEGADSTEMAAKTQYPVIDLMDSQLNVTEKGGTMRLGAYKCELTEGSKAYEAYGQKEIQERHRHRYEFNSKYREDFEKAGMITTGINPESGLTEIVEIPAHKWFVGVQFHPEYKSTVIKPHPLFVSFIKACLS